VANPASACPYCRGAISQELARFGGPCPHCMLEVPGEEAPTDPGLALKQKLAQEAIARAAAERARSQRIAAGSMVLLAGLAVFAIWAVVGGGADTLAISYYQLDPDALKRKQDADAKARAEAQARADAEAAQRAAAARAARRGPEGTPGTPGGNVDEMLAGIGSLGPQGANVGTGAPPAPTPGTDGAAGSALGGGSLALGKPGTAGAQLPVGVGTVSLSGTGSSGPTLPTSSVAMGSRAAAVKTSPGDIQTMIFERFSMYERGLQACWAARLKMDESLKGSWKVSFTVNPDGSVAAPRLKALGKPDPTFEGCALEKIKKWTFLPIARATAFSEDVVY
jgi:hypothetical protein